ncbi:MAG: FAD-binding oxidoreductase [Thermoanaerobaculales bacterium]|nr:FAD-binding oxidoreductase [Thermoanaerobaculales bacterium]
MPTTTAEVVICGAGIAGVSLAYRLAVTHRMRKVILVDERPPLSLTSDKSTEAYRNWWPGPDDAMVRLMNRSIDLLEELAGASGNRFLMSRRGYLYATADPARAEVMRASAEQAAGFGAGELRVHRGRAGDPSYRRLAAAGWQEQPGGADLMLDPGLISRHFPYLSPKLRAALHVRRCGWFSGQQLGMLQLEAARAAGVELLSGRVTAVGTAGGRVSAVTVAAAGGTESIATERFVDAAGPLLAPVGRLLGLELPVFSELHLKVCLEDHLGVVPRDAPLLIWQDPQRLDWSDDEREFLAGSAEGEHLLREMPAGVHLRPEGGGASRQVIILWPYHAERTAEVFPLPLPEHYAEVCARGIAAMIPGFGAYRERLPRPFVDGGYYTKARDNRPLVGPLTVAGAFVHGALSGFGLMASAATAELAASHLTGSALPDYAAAFHPARFADPAYLERLAAWGDSAQL